MPKISLASKSFIATIESIRKQMYQSGGLTADHVSQMNAALDNLIRAIGINQRELSFMLGKLMSIDFTSRLKQIPISEIINQQLPSGIKEKFVEKLGPVERHILESIAARLSMQFNPPGSSQLVLVQVPGTVAVAATGSVTPYAAGPDYSGDPQLRLQQKMATQQMLERERDAALERERARNDLVVTDMRLDEMGRQMEATQRLAKQQIQHQFVQSAVEHNVAIGGIQMQEEAANLGLLNAHVSTLNTQQAQLDGQRDTIAALQQARQALLADRHLGRALPVSVAQPQIAAPASGQLPPAGYHPRFFAPVDASGQAGFAGQPQYTPAAAAAAQPFYAQSMPAQPLAQPIMYAQPKR